VSISRREFLAASAAGVALAAVPQWFAKEAEAAELEQASARPRKFGANDQINIAVIGPGGSKGGYRQGLGVTRGCASHKGVKVVAASISSISMRPLRSSARTAANTRISVNCSRARTSTRS